MKSRFTAGSPLRNSKAISDQEQELSPEILDFYENFINLKFLKKVEIVSYENIEETLQTYTVYNINVETNLLSYTIQKRYSEFRSLSNKIEKKYKELSIYVMNFPGKRLFGKLEKDFIEERLKQLNGILKALGTKYHEEFCYDFLEFLKIREYFESKSITLPQKILFDSSLQNKFTISEERTLLKFLEKMNQETQSLVALFGEIETFFAMTQPILSADFIRLYLFGEQKIKGLISFCGKRHSDDGSHLICTSGLRMFSKLLDFGYNKDAEAFIQIYSKGSTSLISMLQFGLHIIDGKNRPCSSFALRLLDFYIARNPSLKKELILSIIGEYSNYAFEEYEKWKLQNKYISKKTENYESAPNEKKEDLDQIENNEGLDDRKQTISLNSDEIALKSFLINEEKIWETINEIRDKEIKVKHFDGIYIKMIMYLNKSANEAFDILNGKTSIFSLLLEDYKILNEINPTTTITYEKVRWNTSKVIKHLVFISEKKTEKIDENEFYIYKRTMNNYKTNFEIKKEEYLAECIFCIKIASYEKQKKDRKSKITIVCKNFNNNSLLFLSTDLLGETKILAENLKDLKKKCENFSLKN